MSIATDSPSVDVLERRHTSKKRKRHDTENVEGQPSSHKKKQHKAQHEQPSTSHDRPSSSQVSPNTPSPFHIQTASINVPLSPIGIHRLPDRNPRDGLSQRPETELEAVCAEHLSPLLLTYSPTLKGIVLSYHNPRLSSTPHGSSRTEKILARTVDEYRGSFIWVIAEFLLLTLRRGTWIEGHITVQNENCIGLVCWNLFNATIEKNRLPEDWTWVGERGKSGSQGSRRGSRTAEGSEILNGCFEDGEGGRVEGVLRFKVWDFEGMAFAGVGRGFSSIEGTLVEDRKEVDEDGDGNGRKSRKR